MATKRNPGRFDCYSAADPDEPMFILLARDPLAPMLVQLWADLRRLTKGESAKTHDADMCAYAMRNWFRDNKSPQNK